ncbi:MAG: DUF2341 domain-containing protein [Candidatus Bathyarchaeota archaeon]|nr:DUF2341 domain-containing protein [Candidatus Bathyarchaeota archaeon]
MKLDDGKKASVLVLLLLSTFFFSFAPIPAIYGDGENWLEGWSYRKSHVIEKATGAGTNYQVSITVDYGSGSDFEGTVYVNEKCRSNFQDIRFTEDDGETELDYWIEKTGLNDAVFWVEVSGNLTAGDVLIYIYYGNSGVSDTDDYSEIHQGENTFLFFDNFDDDYFNTSKWVEWETGGSYSESNGVLTVTGGSNSWEQIGSKTEVSYNTAIRARYMMEEQDYTQFCYDSRGVGGGSPNLIEVKYSSTWGGKVFQGVVDESYIETKARTTDHSAYSITEIQWFNEKSEYYFDDVLEETLDTYVPTEDMGVGFATRGSTSELLVDWVAVRKCLDNEPNHGSWGKEEGNNVPTNVGFTILDMDDVNNIYAQKRYYTAQYVVIDYDGYEEIGYAEFLITQSSSVRATFRFDEDTSTFSIKSGSSMWDLDIDSCSYVGSGKTLTMNFMISPKFNAIQESDIDISVFVVDSEGQSNTEVIQTDYADVVTDLVISGFSCNDDRGNVGQSLNFSGTVVYANNPSSDTASSSYPPDSEFTAIHIYDSRDASQGSDNRIINGTFLVSFSALSSTGLEAYNPYIDMADAEYTDAKESPTDTFISDRIRILTLGTDDARINLNDSAEIYATAELEYDGHSFGLGDVLSVGSLDLVWNGTHFVGSESKASVQQVVYNEGVGEEATYGVTAVNMNSLSVSVIWDRLNVLLTVDDDLVPSNTKTKFTVTILREYDNSSVSDYSYNITQNGLEFNNSHTKSTFTDISTSEATRTYDFTNVIDNTYCLTAFTDPDDLFVAWYDAGIQLNQTTLIIAVALIVIALVAVIGLQIYRKK